ncbi:MAG: Maf family protein [Clostridiales bacterium]|nr:Maf family protein [Clostridiales bacterium]
MELILASASQRRSELMRNCGYEFTVIPSSASENIGADTPKELVERLALAKALEVFSGLSGERKKGAVVIGSDTVVVMDGEALGKPKDESEAAAMLRRESGRVNTVHTGLAVVKLNASPEGGEELYVSVVSDEAKVRFAELDEDEIAAYVATGDPLDKAGAYGIQGRFSVFVEGIEGSYFTVVGLPVHLVYRELKKVGVLPGKRSEPRRTIAPDPPKFAPQKQLTSVS